ncbi:MAG: Rieske (2Fe-2S) protein [Proteobacteria bacterium]|nr:Rieske (2Fe-2S) protein [Pseudomonadota bacterium]
MSEDRGEDAEAVAGAEGNGEVTRRGWLGRIPGLAALAALAASYGTLLIYFVRYLFPSEPRALAWQYVARVARVKPGETLVYKTPTGHTVNVTRRGSAGTADDFQALSSTCPHLGCQVHWEPQNQRYFCPCHNGVFSPEGVGIGGPPGDAGQSLARYALRVESGLLFMEVPLEALPTQVAQVSELRGPRGCVLADVKRCPGPGHDPCLGAAFPGEFDV